MRVDRANGDSRRTHAASVRRRVDPGQGAERDREQLERIGQRPWLAGSDVLGPWLLLAWLALPLAVPLVRTVRSHTDGPTLNAALARTGMLQLAFCILLSAGILAS